jgi:hypothetical protein
LLQALREMALVWSQFVQSAGDGEQFRGLAGWHELGMR